MSSVDPEHTLNKYLKRVSVNGRAVSGLVDMESSDCVAMISLA